MICDWGGFFFEARRAGQAHAASKATDLLLCFLVHGGGGCGPQDRVNLGKCDRNNLNRTAGALSAGVRWHQETVSSTSSGVG